MRKLVGFVGLLLLLALPAAAQDTPQAEISMGYSYLRVNPGMGLSGFNMNGGSASVAVNINSTWGLVGDFGGYYTGKISGVTVHAKVFTYGFGPRISYRKNDKVTPFAQILVGGAHANASAFGGSAAENAFAMTAGAGVDVKVHERVAIRLFQFEYAPTFFKDIATGDRKAQHNLRLTAGIVFRLGKK